MGMEAADPREGGRLKDIRAFIGSLYGCDLHAKRVDSLAAATLGVMTGASLAVAMIGQALAFVGGPPARLPGDHPGRSRFRRPQTVRLSGWARLCLCYPLAR